MAYIIRSVIAVACVSAGLIGPSFALDAPQRQILIGTTIIEIGGGGASTRGDLGIDFADPLLGGQTKSFSKSRPFVALGIQTPGPALGAGANLAFGAKSQIFTTPKIFDVAFPQAGGDIVNVSGRNSYNVTPFAGIEFGLVPGANQYPRVMIYGGPTISDQKLTTIINGVEVGSNSNTAVSPTVGMQIVSKVTENGMIGLDFEIGGTLQTTFVRGTPELANVPLLNAAITQHRDPEVSAQLILIITPQLARRP